MSVNKHIMLDLETLATTRDSTILSIGAAHFNINTAKIYDTFYVNIDLKDSMKHNFDVDPENIYWWFQQEKEVSEKLTQNVLDVDLSLKYFQRWVWDISDSCKIWGNGILFDNRILRNAFRRMELDYPTGFRNDMDVRTLVELGRMSGIKKTDIIREKEGSLHNALEDALHQVKYVTEIWNHLQK